MATKTKHAYYLERQHKRSSIKTFEDGFAAACEIHPTWSLNRDKNTHAYNVRRDARRFYEHMGAATPIKMFNTTFVREVVSDIMDERRWTESTANKFFSTINKTFDILLREELIHEIPFRIVRFKESEGRTEYFTKEQVDLFCDIAREYDKRDLADLVLFGAYTGLRQAEIRRLRVWDFDFRQEHPFIHVGGTPESRTKTNNYRQVGLNDRLLPLVTRLLEGKSADELIFGKLWPSRQRINREFNHIRTKLIHEDNTVTTGHVFHTLRHSYGTWQIAAGTPVMHVKQTMGHSNVKTTERYVHNTYAAVVNCANAI